MILGPLGDVINTSGLFKQLKKSYPDSQLSIITLKSGIEASKGIPEIDYRYAFVKEKGFLGFFKLLKFGLSFVGKFDTLIVLDNNFRSAFLGFMTLTPKRIGRRGELRELLLTNTISYKAEEKNLEIPVSEHYARCLIPLGIYETGLKTCFSYYEDDKKTAENMFLEYGLNEKIVIGFCPTCYDESKRMKIEDAANFIEEVKLRKNYEVIIVGGKDTIPYIEGLKEKCSAEFIDFTGKTSFLESAAIIDKCSGFVSIDTSPMHIALALDVPTVAIFFTNIYKKWGPSDLNKHRLILNLESKDTDTDTIIKNIDEILV